MSIFVPKDRKSLFRQFLAGLYDAVVITDPNGHVIEINPRAVEHFGYEIEDVADKHISTYIPRMTPEVVQRVRNGLADERHMMIDANGRTKAGDKIACEITVSIIDMTHPGDLVFTIRNVERRREIMNAFRAKSNAFELAPHALFGCDRAARLRDANTAFMQLFGLRDIEEVRQHVFTDFMNDDPLPERFQQALDGKRSVTRLVAEGDEGDRTTLEITLGPNMHGRKNHGVVGCIVKE